VHRNNDSDTERYARKLVPNDRDDLSFDDYVCLGLMVGGGIVGLGLGEIGGGIAGAVVGYLAFVVLIIIWGGITALLNLLR
jgi:hypothetical protein